MRLIEVHKNKPNVPAMSEEEYERYNRTQSKRLITEIWLHYMENIRKIEDLVDRRIKESHIAQKGLSEDELPEEWERVRLDMNYLESWWRPFMEQLFDHFHTHGYYGLSKKHKGWAKQFVRARSQHTVLGIQKGYYHWKKDRRGKKSGRRAYNYTDDVFGRRYKEWEQTAWGKKRTSSCLMPQEVYRKAFWLIW